MDSELFFRRFLDRNRGLVGTMRGSGPSCEERLTPTRKASRKTCFCASVSKMTV